MSYNVKGGKLERRFPKLGEKIVITTGQSRDGQWYWQEETRDDHTLPGPFRSKQEAAEDSRLTVLGPQCEITEGGNWDAAWDRAQ